MSKPMLGLIAGALLGIFDGLSPLVTTPDDPAVMADMVMIISMGVFKGAVAGVAIGFFSRRFRSLPLGIILGLAIGVALALPIALMQGKYYWEIMLPGGAVGTLVGFATQEYGRFVTDAART